MPSVFAYTIIMFKRDDTLHSFVVGTIIVSLILLATALIAYLIGGTPVYYFSLSALTTGIILILPPIAALPIMLKKKVYHGQVLKSKGKVYRETHRDVDAENLHEAIGEYQAPEERIKGSVVDRLRAHTIATTEITDSEYDPQANRYEVAGQTGVRTFGQNADAPLTDSEINKLTASTPHYAETVENRLNRTEQPEETSNPYGASTEDTPPPPPTGGISSGLRALLNNIPENPNQ